jgi:CHASE2 domain-containing sensor protein
MAITVHWSRIGLGSVVAFLIGWFFLGLLGAILIAIVVMVLMGIIEFRKGASVTKHQS